MSTSTVDTIVDGFPFPHITKIEGQPTYETIEELNSQLNANAASVQSDLGGGALGHLALTVLPTVFATLSITPFVIPVNPGPTAVIANGLTAAQITSARLDHTNATALFIKYNNTDKALKQQLVGAVDPLYLKALRNKYTGFGSQTSLTMLRHLYDNYAKISSAELALNDDAMKKQYDANFPIESLFDQIDTAVEYAAAGGAPYTPEQIVTIAFQLVFQTGLFPDDCKLWKRRPVGDKTYAHFKTYFTEAHLELRESQTTTQAGGFQGNNIEQQDSTRDALANLATVTLDQRQEMATLIASNKLLTDKLAEALDTIAELSKLFTALNGNNGSALPRPENTHYCWTHGCKCNHRSRDCTSKKDGHKDRATAAYKLGGTTAIFKPRSPA